MTTKEFIEKYDKATDKELLLKNMIIRQYVPYSEKINDCNRIVFATTKDGDMFKINSPFQIMLFNYTIITKYTDLTLDENQNILEFFEALDELNMVNGLLSVIPEREYNAYNTILAMCNDDLMENTRSLTSFLETKFGALKISTDALLEVLEKMGDGDQSVS